MNNPEYLRKLIDEELEKKLASIKDDCEPVLYESISYSILNRGKRLRPVLMCLVAESVGLDVDRILSPAMALEMIHSYSLVHDDLPCMDNDDFRSGKPTVHKKFGEEIAVLTGDGLLNLAMQTMTGAVLKDQSLAKACLLISDCSGYNGMIGGQILDMTPSELNKDNILNMYAKKTGALLDAAILTPLYVIGADDDTINKYKKFSEATGYAFQISDDLLDYEKEKSEGKVTLATIIGYDETKKIVESYKNIALNTLKELPNSEIIEKYITDIIARTE